MFLHHVNQARIDSGDTLKHPTLLEGDQLMRFNVVVANPPFSLDKWGAENGYKDRYDRFWRGIPPKSVGDYAFISHMIESTYTEPSQNGRVGVIVPHGVLFRAGAEGKIRRALLEENLLDTVIGLPPIILNLKLIQVPKLYTDYVITHELCHLKAHNHSQRFYELLDRVMPDWRERRQRLNEVEVG